MLTPEQTRLRIQDGEIRDLRAEKEQLERKLKDAHQGLKELALLCASRLSQPYKRWVIEMVEDLDE